MQNVGVEVELIGDFLVVKETLERIGIANRKTKVIIPSCYILHKKGKYFIVHFKELLAMDSNKGELSEVDINRRNAIATLLHNWNLLEIISGSVYQETLNEQIFVLPFKEKSFYTINHKYRMRSY